MGKTKSHKIGNDLLPRCEGPKLHAFECENAAIAWGRRLDEDRGDSSTTQSAVFEVTIESRVYALKVFKFYDPYSDAYYWGPLLRDDIPLEEILCYTDPFFAECPVKCHGYLYLSKDDEAFLTELGVDLGIDILDDSLRKALGHGGRVRAIVKDMAPESSGVTARSLTKVLRRVRALNQLDVFNRDIRLENFRGGLLVDFGSSWTKPHIVLDALGAVDKRDSLLEDLVMFDDMVAEEDIKTRLKALPNLEYCEKLRPRTDKAW
ncbi:kinetochore Sim4 complex subunit FTA2-domain-containing protein [Apiospora hydei]|uniref:Kinetochore Sim4 complex subunit FTA2-domain-containing protein n=1 Tax=Apiospora hydei TaxID=1337664 RepID=A0ABR1VUQ4_9PEZI